MKCVCLQTEAVKDMEAKLEEQEQNQHYLDQLLSMLKDRDPTLLHVINSSLASKYVICHCMRLQICFIFVNHLALILRTYDVNICID